MVWCSSKGLLVAEYSKFFYAYFDQAGSTTDQRPNTDCWYTGLTESVDKHFIDLSFIFLAIMNWFIMMGKLWLKGFDLFLKNSE